MLKMFQMFKVLRRSYASEVDPIQQLFIDKVREYERKKKENGGKMFDEIPELEEERKLKYQILLKQYFKDSPPEDATQFPEFTFKDKPLDGIDLETADKK